MPYWFVTDNLRLIQSSQVRISLKMLWSNFPLLPQLSSYNACSSCRQGFTVWVFYPPWWSSFICPLWAEYHLGLVVSLAATLQDQNQTLNRSSETTNIVYGKGNLPPSQQVHSSHWAFSPVFLFVNLLMITNGIAAKFPSVGHVIYYFKLLTFHSSLTSTDLHSALLPFPCSLFYKL